MDDTYRILLVEDDAVIASSIAKILSKWGFCVQACEDFSNVLDTFFEFAPHLLLLDICLPFFNGYYWCGEIRKHSQAPVIFLSSRSEDMDVVMAVNMGGDDYLVKPVSAEVLVAKVQALLRRSYRYDPPLPMLGQARFDAANCVLLDGAIKTELTKNETRILQLLLSAHGEPVTREQLMTGLWESDAFVDDNTLTVNVNRLRKTLAAAGLGDPIETLKARGYRIRA